MARIEQRILKVRSTNIDNTGCAPNVRQGSVRCDIFQPEDDDEMGDPEHEE